MPNKHTEPKEKLYNGHLLVAETYIGGHVEALECGVYRNDLEYRFKIDISVVNQVHMRMILFHTI